VLRTRLPESSDLRFCLIRWFPFWDGVKGISHVSIYRRWQTGARYDDMVAKSINNTILLLQIKWAYKLNLNTTSARRGEPGYNPSYKYDYIYKIIINNTNLFTNEAYLDLWGDQALWTPKPFLHENIYTNDVLTILKWLHCCLRCFLAAFKICPSSWSS
jgi:hypothetical protein